MDKFPSETFIQHYVQNSINTNDQVTDVLFHCKDGFVPSYQIALAPISPFLKSEFHQNSYDKVIAILLPEFVCSEIKEYLLDLFNYNNRRHAELNELLNCAILCNPINIDENDIEEYNDEMYDEMDMLYENAAGIAYGTAFLKKNSKTKEICDIEGQVYDISNELCTESTAFGGVRCNLDIFEQLNLTHSLITSGSQFVLDARLEVSADQASVYTSSIEDSSLSVPKLSGRKYSNVINLPRRGTKIEGKKHYSFSWCGALC